MNFGRSKSRVSQQPVRTEPPERALKDAMETLDRVIEATKANKRKARNLSIVATSLTGPTQK